MKRVAFQNANGSTAKSTSVAALAYLLAEQGQRVLVLDLDPQANVSKDWFGVGREVGMSHAVQQIVANGPSAWPGLSVEDLRPDLRRLVMRAVQHTDYGVDVLAGDTRLQAMIEKWHDLGPAPELLLAELLDALDEDYDVALMDCKGDDGVLSQAAARAATDVVGVATPTIKAINGLKTIKAEADKAGSQMRAVMPVIIRPRTRGADADDIYANMQQLWPTTPPIRGAATIEYAFATHQPIPHREPNSDLSGD